MMRKNIWHNILKTTAVRKARIVVFVIAGATLTLASCADDDGTSAGPRQTVRLLVSVPAQTAAASQHRMGDPGEAVPEAADWDRLTVIMAYTDGSQVMKTTITKADFDKLPAYNGNAGIKLFSIEAQPGKVRIYGVTYSSGVSGADELARKIDACRSETDVQALTISNDYAQGDASAVAKFVSVATGYYKAEGDTPAYFVIQPGGTGAVGTIPTMTLTRLATKIDVQWDVADAVDKGYTDIRLTDFSFHGKTRGRLFPDVSVSSFTPGADQTWTFTNTTPVSQRNGRQYHYTFTDGQTRPTITFNISGKQDGTTDISGGYTMAFQSALQTATWYKVNATVRGMTAGTNTSISIFN